MRPNSARASFFAALAFATAFASPDALVAQDGGIEVFAGETLFDDGWRLSGSYLYTRRGTLYRGSSDFACSSRSVSDSEFVLVAYCIGRARISISRDKEN